MNPKTEARPNKPHFALAVATSLGLGYLPKAPGTFGSLMGVLLAWCTLASSRMPTDGTSLQQARWWSNFAVAECLLAVAVSAIGVWAAGRVATYLHSTDPQIVVVDEVAGQLISYLGLATPRTFAVNWKYLLLGLILFRVFDIWKPFPARQAESLPGGLGIMADDWIAGVYAALLLGFARHLGF
jgi:phosphatidylglycerophosphatase A